MRIQIGDFIFDGIQDEWGIIKDNALSYLGDRASMTLTQFQESYLLDVLRQVQDICEEQHDWTPEEKTGNEFIRNDQLRRILGIISGPLAATDVAASTEGNVEGANAETPA